MESLIRDFFKRFRFLHMKDLVFIYKISEFKSFKQGDILAKKGELFPYTIGIREGIIRTYVLKANGDEITTRFAKERDFTGCAECVINDNPSTEFLEVVEDCKVILFDNKKLKPQLKKNIRLLTLWNESMMQAHLEGINRIEFFALFTPEERYRYILENTPDLIHRIPQKYLASYVGVSTVSISRIRARFLKK